MNTKNKKLKIAIAGLGFGKKVHLEALKAVSYTHLRAHET